MAFHNERVGAASYASNAPEAQRPDGERDAALKGKSGTLNLNTEPREMQTANPARGLSRKNEIETVIKDGMVIGFRCRSWVIFGFLQEAPVGWLIGKRRGTAIEFSKVIYKNRLEAARALETGQLHPKPVQCRECGKRVYMHSTALYCSDACRMVAYRVRKKRSFS